MSALVFFRNLNFVFLFETSDIGFAISAKFFFMCFGLAGLSCLEVLHLLVYVVVSHYMV